MTAVRVIEHALRTYYKDSRDPRGMVATLLAQYDDEQRPVNVTLTKAREAAAAMFEVEAGGPRPQWRVVITDSESPTGIAPVCAAEGDDDLHLWANFGDGVVRVDDGVWDCCPAPQFDTYSTVLAAYLVELLNADMAHGAEGGKDTRDGSSQQGESTHPTPRPGVLPVDSFTRARKRSAVAAFFRCAGYGHGEAPSMRDSA